MPSNWVMATAQEPFTLNGTSPRVMCPSGASACQRIRYAPAFRPEAFVVSVSGDACFSMVKSVVVLSGCSSCNFDRSPSIRVLNTILMGTSGPATVLFATGLVSFSTACPSTSWPTSSPIAKAIPAKICNPVSLRGFILPSPVLAHFQPQFGRLLTIAAWTSHQYKHPSQALSGGHSRSAGAASPVTPRFPGGWLCCLHPRQPTADPADDYQDQRGHKQRGHRER